MKIFHRFYFPCEGKVAYCKTMFIFKISLLKNIFKGFFCFQGFLTIFWRRGEHVFGKASLNDSISCKWFINVSEARFLKRAKNFVTQ